MSRSEDWARRLGIAAVVALLAIAIVVGVRGRPEPPQARVPAADVIADAGPAGVVWIRDGAVVRVDVQSPPGRLVIPRPRRAPWPDGLAVGRQRVWVSSQGLVRGYGPGGRNVRAFRVTPTYPLLLAEGGRRLWAATPGSSRVLGGDLRQRPVRFRGHRVPGTVVDLEALGADAWVLANGQGRQSLLVRVGAGGRTTVVATLPGRPYGVAAALQSIWALTGQGLYRVSLPDLTLHGPYGVTPGTREVAAFPGRVLSLDTTTGIVLDRTLPGTVFTYNLGPGARALTAVARGFWVSVGDAATPRLVEYRRRG